MKPRSRFGGSGLLHGGRELSPNADAEEMGSGLEFRFVPRVGRTSEIIALTVAVHSNRAVDQAGRSGVSLSFGMTAGVMSVAGSASRVTRLFGTRGFARASLNPGLLADIPPGFETETKAGRNLKPPYSRAIRVG